MNIKFVPSIYETSVKLKEMNAYCGWVDKARILTEKEFIEYLKKNKK